jgi:hypothetical protein
VTAVKPMNHIEFSKAIGALGLTQVGAGRFLGVDPRTCRRYVAGELPLPPAAAMLLRVMLAHGLATAADRFWPGSYLGPLTSSFFLISGMSAYRGRRDATMTAVLPK